MKMTIGQLRQLIREFGIDDMIRHEAGLYDTSGVSSNVTDREAILNPPPGLGSPQEDELENDEQQKKSQPGARVYDRSGGAAGPSRPRRTG